MKKHQLVKYYYIAEPSFWPIVGSIGLFCTVLGFVQILHGGSFGPYLTGFGVLILLTTMFGWFGHVIHESLQGLHSPQMDRTYRWAMLWFIVSEVALFTIFFFALFYTRLFTIPELGAAPFEFARDLLMTKGPATHQYLWPHFQAEWPLLTNPDPALFVGPKAVIETWGIPALNTLILLTSAVTVTWAHWGLKKDNRKQLVIGLIATILLGLIFEGFQAHEYIEAYTELGLTLHSGIYGTTFFTLTGLHAMHVSIGIIMLFIILLRCLKGHFQPEHHFAFEAVSWYWHFVDVVWLFLFVFVYWL
ncbi:Cytochrome c oxidase subunit 3 [Aquicella lusitana]|uniref:cytochrome-c oxidase n=2 Tax=Aquicella lusitana TaxID=254246 RepID=A0A370GJ83_9COXI|nr:cytochrome c oxidase subunit 3 [Aquicella lusitana]RDI42444.1 cytochrome c oxidase subunit 3 [Aquicella lusitana]VVC74094.1 Cytochrome c oxidase subunit 3 [Aquicella lusitana]